MRDEQRSLPDVIGTAFGELSCRPDSDREAIPFGMCVQNTGKGPAFNIAVGFALASVLKVRRWHLGGDVQGTLSSFLISISGRRSTNSDFARKLYLTTL